MRILDQARADFKNILEGNDWSTSVTIQGVIVQAWASKHHFDISLETGLPVSGKQAHISVSEQTLTDAGLTVRNANKEVDMNLWLVSYADSSGNERNYQIDSTMPDETLGVITCFLGDFN